MNKIEYISDENHVVHQVLPMDELCAQIQLKYNTLLKRCDALDEENTRLQSEIRNEDGTAYFKNMVDSLNKKFNHGFEISDDESEKINEFIKEHDELHGKAGAIGGRFVYNFLPTSIGIIGTVQCISCDKCLVFRELE